MVRILHVIGRMNRGGAETMVMNLYRAIDRTQFQFDFVSFSDSKGDYDEEIIALGGKIYQIVSSNPLARMFKLEQFLKTHSEYKIVHCHTLLSNAFHTLAAKRANVPYRISHSHNTRNQTKQSLITKYYENWAIKNIRKNSTHFFACGDEAAGFLFPGIENVTIIPNSVDARYFASIADNNKDYLRKEFQLTEQTLIILQLGRLNEVKNHVFSIEVAEQLKNAGIDFRMVFAGQGELKETLEQKVKILGLENEIVFLGLRTDVPYLLAGSDIMLMPSLFEGFPVVLVESQASGVPALIADTISKEVDLGTELVYFESLDQSPEIWANSILEISSKKGLGKNRVSILKKKRFDINESVRTLTDLYKTMI